MPIYVVRCQEHGRGEIFSPHPASTPSGPCPRCGRESPRVWEPPADMTFKSYWTDAGAVGQAGPVEIRSREQEKALCKKYGMERVS